MVNCETKRAGKNPKSFCIFGLLAASCRHSNGVKWKWLKESLEPHGCSETTKKRNERNEDRRGEMSFPAAWLNWAGEVYPEKGCDYRVCLTRLSIETVSFPPCQREQSPVPAPRWGQSWSGRQHGPGARCAQVVWYHYLHLLHGVAASIHTGWVWS